MATKTLLMYKPPLWLNMRPLELASLGSPVRGKEGTGEPGWVCTGCGHVTALHVTALHVARGATTEHQPTAILQPTP